MLAIHDYFGFSHTVLPRPLRYPLIARAGFEGVLLWYGDDWGEEFRAQNHPGLARAAGLQLENAHAPFEEINHIWEDTPDGARVLVCCLRCLEDCARAEIPVVVMHATFGRSDPPPAGDLGLARFWALARRAEELGLRIAMENLCMADRTARAAWLLEEIQLPAFGLCFDTGHQNACTPGAPNLLERFGNRLVALHLHDNHGGERNDEHLLPFDGTIDWPAQMKQLAALGYAGATALEIVNKGHEDLPPDALLALAFGRASRLEELRDAVL
jgi:sugar phosphate isomerase/epimerase